MSLGGVPFLLFPNRKVESSSRGLLGCRFVGYSNSYGTNGNSIAVEIRPGCVAVALGGQSSEKDCTFSDTRATLSGPQVSGLHLARVLGASKQMQQKEECSRDCLSWYSMCSHLHFGVPVYRRRR